MGQAREVYHDRLALGVASEGALEGTSLGVRENVGEINGLRLVVGNLDANQGGAGDRGKDANGFCGKGQRYVILKIDYFINSLAFTHRNLERGDGRAGNPSLNAGSKAELFKRALELLCRGAKL